MGGGVGRVSDFFTMNPYLKLKIKILFVFLFFGGGEGRRGGG